MKNIQKLTFDDEQINIQKRRAKECLKNDIIYKKYDEIRISQMLWGTYFINNRLIELGRLQFELINDNQVKISQEIAQMLDKNSNIVKFQELFGIKQDKNGIDDILNFVFNIRECDDYTNLSEETSLQRKIKAFLINGGIIYNGYGEIKNEEIIS